MIAMLVAEATLYVEDLIYLDILFCLSQLSQLRSNDICKHLPSCVSVTKLARPRYTSKYSWNGGYCVV